MKDHLPEVSDVASTAETFGDVSLLDAQAIKRAEARADRIVALGRLKLGAAPSYFDAYMTVRPLLVRLTALSTRSAYRSFKMVSQLQRACNTPYLPPAVVAACFARPRSMAAADAPAVQPEGAALLDADDEWRRGLLRKCAILSSAVYPASEVLGHGVKNVTKARKWQSMVYRIEHLLPHVKVVDTVEENHVCRPAYAVCTAEKTSTLFIVVRGSASVEDFVTDLMCDPVDGKTGPHRGMALSAEYLDARVRARVKQFVAETPKASVVLTGHSLGAGCAALLCTRWQRDESMAAVTLRLQCVALACPAVMHESDPYTANSQIKVIVFGKDLVPRLSFGVFRDLLVQMTALARLEADGSEGLESVSTAISAMPSCYSPLSNSPARDWSSEDEWDREWELLPEPTEGLDLRQHNEVLIAEAQFPGADSATCAEQNALLREDLKASSVHFGGASFKQVNGLLKRRMRALDRERNRLLRYPRSVGVCTDSLRTKMVLMMYRCVKAFTGCCASSTEYILSDCVTEEDLFLRKCLKEVSRVGSEKNCQFMRPPGQVYLCVPKLHVLEQRLPLPPARTLSGQCYLFRLGDAGDQVVHAQPVWTVAAVKQHLMQCYLQALAPDMLKKFPLEVTCAEKHS